MRKSLRLFAACTAIVMAGSGAAACKSAQPYAAKVNGNVLSKADLDRELNAIKGNAKYRQALESNQVTISGSGEGTFSQQFVAQVLTRRVYFELVREEFVKRKLTLTPGDLTRSRSELEASIGDASVLAEFPKDYLKEIQRTTAQVDKLQAVMASVTDANLHKYYQDHIDQFENVCAHHILVATKTEADSIEKQLAKASDKNATFEQLAKKSSTDTGSGAKGGDLGCASPSTYVAEFKAAVRTQKIGVIGQPVKSQFGYHIIRVDSRDAAKPYDDVKDKVRAAVTDTQQGPFNEFLTAAATKAKVEVNPRYGTYDTTGQQPQVVPPKAPSAAGN